MRRPALIVLDMAGTTVLDSGEVPAAFTAALAASGIEVTPAQIESIRGASKRDAVLALTPAGPDRSAHADNTYQDFVARLGRAYRDGGVVAVDGAEHVFRHFRGSGVKIALNTGFDSAVAGLLMRELKWEGAVDTLVCGDEVALGRPAPGLIQEAMRRLGVEDPGDVANVGDTELDLQAAAAAHVRWNIGVLSGAHDRSRLQKWPCNALLNSIADLPAFFA